MSMFEPLRHSRRVIGVVVIGRNEGDRLATCLRTMPWSPAAIVYVDSGSTDGSRELARSQGVAVLALDLGIPFTAARARNEGFRRLCELAPGVSYVQFIDGDCELAPTWLDRAAAFLDEHPRVAVVCGRRRERHPGRSVYNLLCDIEWDTPVGETRSCGGDAMMRVDAFSGTGGFASELIAGEEPELCVRLRAAGWLIWRLPAEMTRHDAAMRRFGQWWRRSERAGHAFAQGAGMHGGPPERHWVREVRSAWIWAAAIPLAAAAAAAAWGAWGLALLAVYPLQVARLARRGKRTRRENWWRAVFLVLGKFPEALGQAKFHLHRRAGRRLRLIEYK